MLSAKKSSYNWLIWLVLFLAFGVAVYVLRSVLLPFVAGLIIGYLLDPLADRFEKIGLSRTWATILVLLLVVIIVFPLLLLLLGVVQEQISQFLSSLPAYISALTKKIEPIFVELQQRFPSLEAEKIRQYVQNNMANAMRVFGKLVAKVISGGFAFFNVISLLLITPVVAFYMVRDWNDFVEKVRSLLPRHSKANIEKQMREIDSIIASFIRGQLSVCVLLGTFYACGLYIVGLDLGVMIGFIAGIISFIPYVGSISGFVVSMAIAFAQFSEVGRILAVAGVFAVGQFLEGNFLTPKLVGDSVGLHPVWVMFALLAGGVLLGFLGLMIAVPVAAIIGVLVRHAIENYKHSSLYLED